MLLAAACSQEEYPAGMEADSFVPDTLSATIDHGVQTRATSTTDDEVKCCLLQIIESDGLSATNHDVQEMTLGDNDTYTASVMLNSTRTYEFLF